VLEEGAQVVADPKPAGADENDRPRHIELLVGELRPLDRLGLVIDGRARMGETLYVPMPDQARSRWKCSARVLRREGRPPQWLMLRNQAVAATRIPTQAGRSSGASSAKVATMPPAHRMSLRAPAGSVAALSKALGVTLPQKPKTSAAKGSRTALWLGPDEWLVIDDGAKRSAGGIAPA
jgi:hypothetical protein